MASSSQGVRNPKADTLYSKCFELSSTTETFNQADLVSMDIASNLSELLQLCQQLMQANLFQILTLDGTPCYRCRTREDAAKMSDMGDKEFMVYSMIEASGTTGIWTKMLGVRTNLHTSVLTKALKFLEGKSYVKQIKSVKFPKRKIYMLKELDPAEEVTGGPWFSDGELDTDFIASIAGVVENFVKERSWREGPKPVLSVPQQRPKSTNKSATKASKSTNANNNKNVNGDNETTDDGTLKDSRFYGQAVSAHGRPLIPHPPGYAKYPTTSDILTWIDSMGIIQEKDITHADMNTLLDVLVYDNKLERMGKRPVVRTTTTPAAIKVKRQRRASNSDLEDQDGSDGEEDANENDDDDGNDSSVPRSRKRVKQTTTSKAKGKQKLTANTTNNPPPAPPPHQEYEDTFRWIRRPDSEDPAATADDNDGIMNGGNLDGGGGGGGGPGNGLSEAPCARCPVFRLCEDGGPVDARSCGYFPGWLEV